MPKAVEFALNPALSAGPNSCVFGRVRAGVGGISRPHIVDAELVKHARDWRACRSGVKIGRQLVCGRRRQKCVERDRGVRGP